MGVNVPRDLADELRPCIDHLVTEDDEPVDNLFSAKQQRLLVEPLYTSWVPEREFLADSNVGVFSHVHRQALVPDAFLSLDVSAPEEWWAKEHRSYMIWEYGKAPDVVVEVVSNLKGGEKSDKLQDYARMAVAFYAVYDPQLLLGSELLSVYELNLGLRRYRRLKRGWLAPVGLGLTLWEGTYEKAHGLWVRWCDAHESVLATGKELSDGERARADGERARADGERARADQEQARAERLAQQLRALGIEPA